MTDGHGVDNWTEWPSREAVDREGRTRARLWFAYGGRCVGLGAVLWVTFAQEHRDAAHTWAVAAIAAVGVLAFWRFLRRSREQRLTPALLWVAVVFVQALFAVTNGGEALGVLLMCVIALGSLQRLPLIVAVPAVSLGTLLFLLLASASVQGYGNAAVITGLGVLGYVTRMDWEARANTQRLLAQERAARVAEAESAALAERARIAREIHDVLAHSLSAQLVHLEAARVMLDAGADRAQLRERIVAARRMAQDGLAETKQALSALRGEFAPVSEFLKTLAEADGATVEIEGLARPLGAEAGVAVRRTAQEALTNIRKHAPGAPCAIRLSYLKGSVELEVRNGAAARREDGPDGAELTRSGSGLGLLGMRERAELLGGSLQAGPDGEGFKVLLRVPAA
ncbi:MULTISPECIES: sensor histidine kinase [Streptacidiphilus]|uniref:histidine kinase n=1 Tax=Streptacidiphilus cavernicola TaxID=3342716 RepID=A0ABV6UWP4_9ACTN|nr:histidine kinase [Streptacidiphilus jeojiense]